MPQGELTINEGFNPKGQAELIIKTAGLSFIKPKFYNVKPNEKEIEAQEVGVFNASEYSGVSKFGLPVFDILEFDVLRYKTLEGKAVTVDSLNLGITLITITQSKNIVTTPIQGRTGGTIKEYISDGDYQINIKGVLVGDGNEVKPQGQKDVLIGFCQAPVEINIASPLLNDFGIYTLVIMDYNFPQIEGQRNVVPFELNCLSDKPIELKSKSLS